MNVKFLLEHINNKLFQLAALQAAIMVAIFTLFFYSVGFAFYYALLAATGVYLAIACLYKLLNLPFYILPKIAGAVYVPTTDAQLETMVSLAKVRKGQKSIDLGSGDGRVVAAFAQKGADAAGVELNSEMVERSEELFAQKNLKNAHVAWQSLWETELSTYDIITIYGVPDIMRNLSKKLKREAKPGALIISNQYPLPKWPVEKEKLGVYLYIKK